MCVYYIKVNEKFEVIDDKKRKICFNISPMNNDNVRVSKFSHNNFYMKMNRMGFVIKQLLPRQFKKIVKCIFGK